MRCFLMKAWDVKNENLDPNNSAVVQVIESNERIQALTYSWATLYCRNDGEQVTGLRLGLRKWRVTASFPAVFRR